jgi:hypothetical protein
MLSASAAQAQQSADPPPQPDTTTVTEPLGEPDKAPPPADEKPPAEGPAHVPKDASGLNLSTLETDNFSLLYFDPPQTYLTPYIGRAFENALACHKRTFDWQPCERTTVLL